MVSLSAAPRERKLGHVMMVTNRMTWYEGVAVELMDTPFSSRFFGGGHFVLGLQGKCLSMMMASCRGVKAV